MLVLFLANRMGGILRHTLAYTSTTLKQVDASFDAGNHYETINVINEYKPFEPHY